MIKNVILGDENFKKIILAKEDTNKVKHRKIFDNLAGEILIKHGLGLNSFDIKDWVEKEREKQKEILNNRRKFITASKITGNLGKPNINFDADADIWLVPTKSISTPGVEQTKIGASNLKETIRRKIEEGTLPKKRRMEGEGNGGGELEDGVSDGASGEGDGGKSVVGGSGMEDGIGIAGVSGINNGAGAVETTTVKKSMKKPKKRTKQQEQIIFLSLL